MQNLLHEEDEYIVSGFINSSGELEFNIYEQVDGGCLTLSDDKYDEKKLLDLLHIELKSYLNIVKYKDK